MSPAQLHASLRATVDEVFARFFDEGKAGPGLAYGLVRDGHLVHANGLGTAEAGVERPIDADTVFRIASMSKSFTAAAILVLRDDGKLGLDDEIHRFIPAIGLTADEAGDAQALTIRHCLTMSGGLPTDDAWADRLEALTRGEFDDLLKAGVRFIDAPGVRYEYSNLGFALLGRVIEHVSGHEFTEFVRLRLLEPLDLGATRYDYAEVPAERRAIGHRRSPNGPIAVPFSSPGSFSPIGGVLSSVRDIAKWVTWLADAFPAGTQNAAAMDAVLARSSRREMQQLHRAIRIRRSNEVALDGGSIISSSTQPVSPGYGYGLFSDEDGRWGSLVHHSGGYPGFGSHMRWHPESGWGVIAFANSVYAPVSAPAAEALSLVLDGANEPLVAVEPWPELDAARRAIERMLTGADDDFADTIFAANLLQDEPAAERIAGVKAALAVSGQLRGGEPLEMRAPTPAQLLWSLPTEHGSLHLEVRLTPTTPALVQSYVLRAVPAHST